MKKIKQALTHKHKKISKWNWKWNVTASSFFNILRFIVLFVSSSYSYLLSFMDIIIILLKYYVAWLHMLLYFIWSFTHWAALRRSWFRKLNLFLIRISLSHYHDNIILEVAFFSLKYIFRDVKIKMLAITLK